MPAIAAVLYQLCKGKPAAAEAFGRWLRSWAPTRIPSYGKIASVQPTVSVIIPAWNGAPWIDACLASALAHLPASTDFIVVDDASTDDTAAIVARHETTGRVRLFHNTINEGFARTVNRGLAEARGAVVALLNQDSLTPGDWLSPLLAAMGADNRVGIAGCRLLYPDGSVQHAGGRIDRRGEGTHDRVDPPLGPDGLADMDYVTGAALAMRRSCLEAIGSLDEKFAQAYYEDVDLCFRARRAGFRVVYCPAAELVHVEASLSARQDLEGMARFQGNRLRLVLKHFPVDRIAGEFLALEQTWLRGLGARGAILVAAMQRVYYRHLLGLPGIAQSRGADKCEVDTIAEVLTTLRATAPLA